MAAFTNDLRHALRALWRNPAFTAAAVLSIGLGVGANTTVFAWLDNIVRHPFPGIPDGGALVALNVADQDGRVQGMAPVSYPALEEWRSRVTAFAGVAAHAQARLNLRPAPGALGEPVWVEIAGANFFEVLGVRAAAGRTFSTADEAAQAPVVVISHAFWQRRFGGGDVIGRTLLFNGSPLTVIGIAPPRFGGVVMGLAFDAWVPLWQQRALLPGSDWMRDRSARRLQAVARLKTGVTIEQARGDLLAAAREVSREYGESPVSGAGARWVSDTQLGSLMGPLAAAMMAITVVVLLAACANVSGLLLARSAGRRRQTAIQVAIGASRARLVQQALTHSGILALAGCAAGLWMAAAARDALLVFVPPVGQPVSLAVDINWRVWLFAAAATALAMLLFAIVPALRASRPDVVEALKSSSGGAAGRQSRLRQALVVAQVAASFLSLATAGLFLRSVAAAGAAPLGFDDPGEVLLVSTDLSFTRLEGEARTMVVDRALAAARALPGVAAAAAATAVPLSFGGPAGVATRVDGYVPQAGESMFVGRVVATDGYFETMGIPLIEGRSIDGRDRASSARVVVVNQSFVRRYWPGGGAVGRRIDQGGGWATVIGVARDSVVDNLTEAPRPLAYHPYGQLTPDAITVHLRSRSNPLALVEPLRQAWSAINPDLPALDPRTMKEHMGAGTFVQSVGAGTFGAFGVIALLIAAVGLYGVMASYVAERRREIAVSVAIGATPRSVAAAVAGPALRLTAIGLSAGAALSLLVSSLVRNQLVGVAAIDAVSLLTAAAAMALVAVAACAGPVWRAVRVDPVAALRSQ